MPTRTARSVIDPTISADLCKAAPCAAASRLRGSAPALGGERRGLDNVGFCPRAAKPLTAIPNRLMPMPRRPIVARTVPALRRAIDGFRARKATVALVPTMGALHDGHVSLVRLAKRRAAKVVVSIFVNPAQFAPTEDFSSYPRTWKSDMAKLSAEKRRSGLESRRQDHVSGWLRHAHRAGGPATAGLEDRFRPHFFGGVATVVGKLFTQVPAGFCDLRRKGFSATSGGGAHGGRSRSRRQGDRIEDGARARRARDVIAQRLPLRRRAPRGEANCFAR